MLFLFAKVSLVVASMEGGQEGKRGSSAYQSDHAQQTSRLHEVVFLALNDNTALRRFVNSESVAQ
jgi:hypothetical protein